MRSVTATASVIASPADFEIETGDGVLGRVAHQPHLADSDITQDLRASTDGQKAATRRWLWRAAFRQRCESFQLFGDIAVRAFVGQ